LNSTAGNYDLQPSSPAVDYGTDLTAEGVTFDILNRSRPFHGLFDAGAYECQDTSLGIRATSALDIDLFKIYPNPAHSEVRLLVKTSRKQDILVVVTDISGRTIFRENIQCMPFENTLRKLSVRKLKSGEYWVVLYSLQGISTRPLVIKK
jgi:hypothetical protein